ncbi:MAG: hypothetical protein JWM33_570 [Caulobacteraceae bacterium]|nr:hypothetical protein [Caulobacteraceae bacterium]
MDLRRLFKRKLPPAEPPLGVWEAAACRERIAALDQALRYPALTAGERMTRNLLQRNRDALAKRLDAYEAGGEG